ncbi:DUF3558 family protein [Saccharopolyspora hordei]|uniref:DUF3558 domain-containing protein n=1 Tax=Saccharopolyspora hordei TaxID=1838 RepID=A0A853AHN9_9PSEU|nr:hypothetical protein [Saccharopolyspora hordei]
MKRSAVLGATLTAVLAACGNQAPDSDEGAPQTTRASSGPQVNDPKDATAIQPCDFLSADAATNLGVKPAGREVEDSSNRICSWSSPDDRDRLGLSAIPNRSLSSYLDNRSQFADFAELTIAGHPAVRANRNDPKKTGGCAIFLATKDDQVLSSQVDFFDKTKDPCSLAQQALEAVVPALPVAR